MAADFDGDGDLDLAAISYYPDWSADVPQTFVYFENQGDYRFSASTPGREHWGHWLTMACADVDDDGHKDLVLGGGYKDNGVPTDLREKYHALIRGRPSVLVLKNIGSTDR